MGAFAFAFGEETLPLAMPVKGNAPLPGRVHILVHIKCLTQSSRKLQIPSPAAARHFAYCRKRLRQS